ncbi:preprotein translocase subunit SecA [Geodermatophilus sp. SYSU D00742]
MVFSKILRAGEGKILRRLNKIADAVESLADDVADLTDAELRAKTDEFKERLDEGETLDHLLPEAFAVVREAATRTLGQRHFRVQIMGGAALHLGNIAEMRTGEGKTLTGVLPAYLNALTGQGVHVVTVNDYLAKRDAEWMGRVHRFLGLSVGTILSGERPAHRREQYACDITYGTNNEFGFDYLRDNMAWSKADLVQRGHHYAIVDEVDSILIDEARTPLIISGPAESAGKWYQEFARIVPLMRRDVHYEVEEAKRTVAVTEEGVEFVEDQLGIDNLYEAVNSPLISYLNNALKAKELYHRDQQYIVTNGEVLIVDEFTGRVLSGRRYNEGMHQAIEAKERVQIKDENQTLATITLQNYFRLYDKLSGMTGTAQTEAAELSQTYKLGVVPIPTNRPMVRQDRSDVIYKTESAKFDAVIDDIAERHEKGQPVLVGTASVEKSEVLSKLLLRRGIPHEVLNAKNHAREAHIVAQAGRLGAVTVATNMAGRGTDIQLGGNPDFIADEALRARGLSPSETPEEYEAAWDDALAAAREQVKAEHEEVASEEVGGLYVLGTERHESRRIDNQLRGRSGRQGDRGESRFYLSLGDDLMRRFNGPMLESMMTTLRVPDDQPIESKMVTRAIRSAQTQVEQQNFEVRKDVLKYDEVLNRQRTVIYEERRKVLDGQDLHEQVRSMVDDVVSAYVDGATETGYAEDWDLEQLWTGLKALYPVGLDRDELIDRVADGDQAALTADVLKQELLDDVHRAYEEREAALGSEVMRELERRVLLSVLDRKWREHLYEMDYLRAGIHLRAMANRDPVVEYQREGYDMFNQMLDGIKEESVGFLFNLEVKTKEQQEAEAAAKQAEAEAKALAAAQQGTARVLARQAAAAKAAAPAVDGNGTATPGAAAAPAPAPTAPPAAAPAPTAAPAAAAAPAPAGASAPAKAPAARRSAKARPAEVAPAAEAPVAGEPASSGTGPQLAVKGLDEPRRSAENLSYSAPSLDASPKESGPAKAAKTATVTGTKEPARNAPCPCGSGKKYKACHGAPSRA